MNRAPLVGHLGHQVSVESWPAGGANARGARRGFSRHVCKYAPVSAVPAADPGCAHEDYAQIVVVRRDHCVLAEEALVEESDTAVKKRPPGALDAGAAVNAVQVAAFEAPHEAAPPTVRVVAR